MVLAKTRKRSILKLPKKHGNDWKEICKYISKNGQNVLPTAVYKKYIDSEKDKEKMKSIRNRIGNIRRKMK